MSIIAIIWLNTAHSLTSLKIPPDGFGLACVWTEGSRMSNPFNKQWKAHSSPFFFFFFFLVQGLRPKNFGLRSQSSVGWSWMSLDIKKVQKPLFCEKTFLLEGKTIWEK